MSPFWSMIFIVPLCLISLLASRDLDAKNLLEFQRAGGTKVSTQKISKTTYNGLDRPKYSTKPTDRVFFRNLFPASLEVTIPY